MQQKKKAKFSNTPAIIMWEITRACDLLCSPCRAEAQTKISQNELTLKDINKTFIDINKNFSNPLLVLTGGDPLKRPDLADIIRSARSNNINTSLNLSPTALVTKNIIEEFKKNDVSRIAINLDGSRPKIHDAFRRLNGSFRYCQNVIKTLEKTNVPVQLNTTITKFNYFDFHNILRFAKHLNVVDWLVFFLVPSERMLKEDSIETAKYEKVFDKIYNLKEMLKFKLRVIDAPHYRRFAIEKLILKKNPNFLELPRQKKLNFITELSSTYPLGIRDGNGYIFINNSGEVYPSRYLPISCGNIKKKSISQIYKTSNILKTIRDHNKLKGKCGACEYKLICGGSRARAFAYTGDYLAADPSCLYNPIA